MSGSFSAINLSELAAPAIVEPLSFEQIFDAMLADLQARDATFTALVESDPAYKILEVCAYRELLLRARINDACYAVMLAYAMGTDLDQIGANLGVVRLLIDDGDPDAIPPVDPTYESDDDFRRRIQLSFEGYTTAGSEGSYVFHGLGADGDVKDIAAVSPTPGNVTVYVLARSGDGTAGSALLAKVSAALNAEQVRPLTDHVTVQSATITSYAITAELVMFPGPDAEVVRAAALAAAQKYAEATAKIGYDVTLSGIYAALHQPGVQRVNLTAPAANIVLGDGQASHCTGITLTIAAATDV